MIGGRQDKYKFESTAKRSTMVLLHLKAKVLLLWITMKEWGETSRKIDYLISHVTFHVTFQCMFPAITFESRGSSQVEDERDSISISTIYSLW